MKDFNFMKSQEIRLAEKIKNKMSWRHMLTLEGLMAWRNVPQKYTCHVKFIARFAIFSCQISYYIWAGGEIPLAVFKVHFL